MINLTEEIGRICNLLEDAHEEQDWAVVKKMIDALDKIYNDLDRADNGFLEDEY
jgi:hypothetical protein